MNNQPNPGSPEAIEKGCECPVIDNVHGRGSGHYADDGSPLFWISGDCKLHGGRDE
jgi:hypothetical protein